MAAHKTSVYVPDDLWDFAREHNISLSELLQDALRNHWESLKRAQNCEDEKEFAHAVGELVRARNPESIDEAEHRFALALNKLRHGGAGAHD